MFHSIDFVIVIVTLLLSILVGFIPKFSRYYRSVLNRLSAKDDAADPKKGAASSAGHAHGDEHEDLEYYYYYYASSEADLHKNELIKGAGAKSRQRAAQAAAAAAAQDKKKPNFVLNAISLVVGFQSVLHVVGLPVEFYYHGFQSFQYMLSFIVAPVIISVFLVPFIYKLKSKSVNEYLDDKFDGHKSVKVTALFIVLIFQFLFSALVLFSASITIMQTLSNYPGLSLWMIVVVLAALSALLAMLGLQSVIWSNLLQYLIMIGCNVTFIVLGIKYYNGYEAPSFDAGFRAMWNTTVESGRGELFQFDENFRYRYTFLNGLIGVTFNIIPTYSFTQQSYMRIKQAKSVTSARLLLIAMIPFGVLNLTLIYFLGFVMFGYFYKCGDPFSSGLIKNRNQILAKFLTQFFDKYNGLLGLYIALLISNAIGSLSNALKALSITLTEDILLRFKFFNSTSSSSNSKRAAEKNLIASPNSNANEAEPNTTYYKIRSFSFDRENMIESYEEERLALKYTGFKSKKKQRRIIKKFQRKDERFKRRLSVSIMVISSALVAIVAILIEKTPDSITSTTFSLLNSTHGPLLFIYLCARFNEFSIKRTQYAHNTSTKSKWKYFRLEHSHVVVSCVLSIAVVLCLFVGKLSTYNEAAGFYNFDQLPVNVVTSRTNELREFCAYEEDRLHGFGRGNLSTTPALGDHFKHSSTRRPPAGWTTAARPVNVSSNPKTTQTQNLNFMNYLFGISFNWYPFIGFSVCFVSCLALTTLALIFSYISKRCFRRLTLV